MAVKLLGARKEAILQAKDAEGNVVEEYQALFTTRALADAEFKLGKSITLIVTGFANGRSGVREIAALLQAGLEAHRKASGSPGDPVSYEDACDVLDMVGVEPASDAIGAAVGAVLAYGKKKTPDAPEKN